MDEKKKPTRKSDKTDKLDVENAGRLISKDRRELRPGILMPEVAEFGGRPLDTDTTDVVKRVEKPEGLLSGEWLQGMSDQELVITFLALYQEIQTRVGESTDTITKAVPDLSEFAAAMDSSHLSLGTDDFKRLPSSKVRGRAAETDATWRFILITSDPKQKLLRLEVVADTVIGRVGEDTMPPHLDLCEHFTTAQGISRRHALLRPTERELYLIDLGSTNGTFLNQKRLPPRTNHKVSDEDIISFANLHFKIMFVSQPAGASRD
jgi:hypothetical protein